MISVRCLSLTRFRPLPEPALIINNEEIDIALAILEESFQEVLRA